MTTPIRPIRLYKSTTTKEIDGAGNIITKTVLPPPSTSAPAYSNPRFSQPEFDWVPPLSYFCLKVLKEFPDQINQLGGYRLNIQPRRTRGHKLLRSLFPLWKTPHFSLLNVDPRIWAITAQVYKDLPSKLWSYPISLSDSYLPLLNQIPPSPEFSLLTVLDLANSRHLTDNNIISLKALHNLAALDVSNTETTSRGIILLSRTITYEIDRRGPGLLRILKCRDTLVNDDIFGVLDRFPLLCAIDLRETNCSKVRVQYPFSKSEEYELFDAPLVEAIRMLTRSYDKSEALENEHPYILDVHEESKFNPTLKSMLRASIWSEPPRSLHNSFVVFPGTREGSSVAPPSFGNADSVEFRRQQGEEVVEHFAWNVPQDQVQGDRAGNQNRDFRPLDSDNESDVSDEDIATSIFNVSAASKSRPELGSILLANTVQRGVSAESFYKKRPDTTVPTLRRANIDRGLIMTRSPPPIQVLYDRLKSGTTPTTTRQGQEEIKMVNNRKRKAFNEHMTLLVKRRKPICTNLLPIEVNEDNPPTPSIDGSCDTRRVRVVDEVTQKPTSLHIASRKAKLKLEPSPSHVSQISRPNTARFSNVTSQQQSRIEESKNHKVPPMKSLGGVFRASSSNNSNSLTPKFTSSKLANKSTPPPQKIFDWQNWVKK